MVFVMGYSMVFVVGYFMVFVMGYKSESFNYSSLGRLGEKGVKKKKVECFVSIRKKTQKEGISISFLFQVNTTVLKHTVDFKRKQRNPTFSHILLGQPGHRSRNKERKTTRKRPNPTEGVP